MIDTGVLKRELQEGRGKTSAAIIDLGPAQIITFPGEALSGFRAQVEPLLPGPHRLFFSLTNDSVGYIVPQDEWDDCQERFPNLGCHEEANSASRSIAPLLGGAYSQMADRVFGQTPR